MSEVIDSTQNANTLNLLEERLRTANDFANLDALVRTVEERQDTLKLQVGSVYIFGRKMKGQLIANLHFSFKLPNAN